MMAKTEMMFRFSIVTIFLIYRACPMYSALYSVFMRNHNYIVGIQAVFSQTAFLPAPEKSLDCFPCI